MTIRTSTKTVTFSRPFVLTGVVGLQPAGSYDVETNEELLQTPVPAYRTISTLIRLPALNQVVDIDSAEMSAVLERELTAQREEEVERQKAYWDSRE
jgi:hypothetical protein